MGCTCKKKLVEQNTCVYPEHRTIFSKNCPEEVISKSLCLQIKEGRWEKTLACLGLFSAGGYMTDGHKQADFTLFLFCFVLFLIC